MSQVQGDEMQLHTTYYMYYVAYYIYSQKELFSKHKTRILCKY